MKKFSLNHVVLYAKGWYDADGLDLWEVIKKLLKADGYRSADHYTNIDCTNVILSQYERLPRKKENYLRDMINGIRKSNCWRYGYYTKEVYNKDKSLPDYDMDAAIIYYCLYQFSIVEVENLPELKTPDSSILPTPLMNQWYEIMERRKSTK